MENFIESEWTRRSVLAEPRLSEAVELYQELGFEVFLKEVTQDECSPEECNTCLMEDSSRYKIIFTK